MHQNPQSAELATALPLMLEQGLPGRGVTLGEQQQFTTPYSPDTRYPQLWGNGYELSR